MVDVILSEIEEISDIIELAINGPGPTYQSGLGIVIFLN